MGRFLGGSSASPRGAASAETTRRGGRSYEAVPASNVDDGRTPSAAREREQRLAQQDDDEENDQDQAGEEEGEFVQLRTGPSSSSSTDAETRAQSEAPVVTVVASKGETPSDRSDNNRTEDGAARRDGDEEEDEQEQALEPGFIRVRILDLNGKYFNIACQLEWTVAQLKEKVLESTEVALVSQRLIYRGRVLEDDKVLDEYKLEDGHTIHLFVRMNQNPEPEPVTESSGSGAAGTHALNRFEDGVTIVHITSETISSAVFPSDSARRVDPLMLDSPLGNCARRVKLWSSFLLIIYTMKVMGQFALLANDQQMRAEENNKDDTNQDRYYDRYDYPPYYNQDPMVSAVELMIHAFGVYIGCVGFKAAHDTDIRPIRFYCRGIVWLAILTVAEQVYITFQISQSDYPETRIQYPYGPAAPSKDDIVSANIFQSVMLVVMWVIAIHHSYAHQAEVARYNQSFAAAAMNAVPPAHLPEVV